jgi:hypothetical protein
MIVLFICLIFVTDFRGTFPALTGIAALAYFVQNCCVSICRNQKCPENNVSLIKLQAHIQGVMVFNIPFNNISFILWRSVLLVEKTGVPREKQITDNLYHIML